MSAKISLYKIDELPKCHFTPALATGLRDKMPIDLYYTPESTAVRAVRLVAAALDVPLNLKLVNLTAGDQLKPEFLKMNIQHTVPTIDDNGFYLHESRAIILYLCEKYCKNDKLFPEDIKKRAYVYQQMCFDYGTLYQSLVNYYFPVIFEGASFNPAGLIKINQAFEFLDKYLSAQEYLAGPYMTVADLTALATVSTFEYLGYNFTKYKNVTRWYSHMKTVAPKYKEMNEDGVKMFAEVAAPFLRQ